MLLWERRRPGRRFATVPGWLPRAIVLNVAQGVIAFVASVTWDRWLPGLALWDVGGESVIADALVGYVTLTFVYYWWHRARHEVPFLWRWFHQAHHSATRVEVLTSFYKHPAEMAANGLLSSLVLFVLLGLEPAAAALAVTLTGLAELFYHWNVRTPYWLGFFLQRPESHCVHHRRGHHASNFSDLPIWDLLFGTFHNPRTAPEECGFGPDIERRLPELLLGRGHSPGRETS
jgi:sterol desaturase/sphingolipid hydroxylase (fatty acid hydroxylase superfamily)